MSSSSFSTRHRRRASIVATVIALLATLISASPASASFTGNEPITTIAGNGSDGFSGDNGPATDATLRYPSGVAVDNDGNLYIADTINQRIRRIDAATGTIATIAGTGTAGFSGDNGPATNAELRNPHGVAVDSDDNVYIADTDNDRIRRIDAANGTITTIAGDGNGMYGGDGGPATNASMSSPYDVAVDDGGNVYIADALNSRIRRIDTTGTITTIAGSGSNGMGGGFGGDNGPATDATVFLPQSVAVDDDGNVYIADTFNHRIRRIDAATGIITTIAGTGANGVSGGGFSGDNGPATDATLNQPSGVALDSDGNLYIGDTANHRVRQVDTGGTITTIAGDGNGTYGGDGGPAANAQFSYPRGVASDFDGNLYIADSRNHSIRQISAPDTTEPTIDLTGIADGASITNGETATVDFTCTDTGWGVDTCTATLDGVAIASGDALDTTTDGDRTLVVTAVDLAGNTTTQTITYTVAPGIGPRELTGDYAEASGTNGSVARLYMAVFNRQPDGQGYQFWVNAHDNGDWTLRRMAAHFITSPEFVDTYGSLSNTQFIDQLYQNVMLRPGDPQGLQFWNQQIANGMTRADIVLHFSESPEFKTLTGSN